MPFWNKPVKLDLTFNHGWLADVLTALQTLERKIDKISATLSDEISKLQADVQSQTSAVQSAETLISGLSDQLKAALASATNAGATADQLAALSTLSATLESDTSGLSAAVAANTPAAQAPAPVPDVAPAAS